MDNAAAAAAAVIIQTNDFVDSENENEQENKI
jgi:hypothetical protein